MLVRVDAIILTVSPVKPVFHKLKDKHIAYIIWTEYPKIYEYRRHSKECMWRQRGHFYMVFKVYDSKVIRGKGEAHVALY